MTWLRGAPEGRVWAVVLWDHSPHSVPFIGQYEPRFDKWISETRDSFPSVECSYAELPYHELFNERTHLFTKDEIK